MLIDLAAGRGPDSVVCDSDVVASAIEHRMTGLLWTWASTHLPDGPERTRLAMEDLRVQAHLRRLWSCLESSVERLHAIGIDVATVKGVTAEARWYQRSGERLCSDVDLLLSPAQLGRASEAVAALQPDHPWLPHIDELASSGRLQSITLHVDGLEVDLHFDLLKIGIPTRQAIEFWERTAEFALPRGGTVKVLDDTVALLHLLVHLNKDRFQRLLGYADIARVIGARQVSWLDLRRMADREGLEVPVFCTLQTVLDELGLAWPHDLPVPRGARAISWRFLWRERVRLRGREGRLRFRRRQDWIAFLGQGRIRAAANWWVRDLVPPRATVRTRYAHIAGPYVWQLFRGRAEAHSAQRREIRARR